MGKSNIIMQSSVSENLASFHSFNLVDPLFHFLHHIPRSVFPQESPILVGLLNQPLQARQALPINVAKADHFRIGAGLGLRLLLFMAGSLRVELPLQVFSQVSGEPARMWGQLFFFVVSSSLKSGVGFELSTLLFSGAEGQFYLFLEFFVLHSLKQKARLKRWHLRVITILLPLQLYVLVVDAPQQFLEFIELYLFSAIGYLFESAEDEFLCDELFVKKFDIFAENKKLSHRHSSALILNTVEGSALAEILLLSAVVLIQIPESFPYTLLVPGYEVQLLGCNLGHSRLLLLFLHLFGHVHQVPSWNFGLGHLKPLYEVLLLRCFGFWHVKLLDFLHYYRLLLFFGLFFLSGRGLLLLGHLDLYLLWHFLVENSRLLLLLFKPILHARKYHIKQHIDVEGHILSLVGGAVPLDNIPLNAVLRSGEELLHEGVLVPEIKHLLHDAYHLVDVDVLELVLFQALDFELIVDFLLDEAAVSLDVDEQVGLHLLLHGNQIYYYAQLYNPSRPDTTCPRTQIKPHSTTIQYNWQKMSTEVYDEIEIEDLDFDAESTTFYYPCPCGDKFQITLEDIKNGEVIAKCPSCSLTIRIVYDQRSYEEFRAIAEEMKA